MHERGLKHKAHRVRRLAHPCASGLLRVSLTCLLKTDQVLQEQADTAAAGPSPACL